MAMMCLLRPFGPNGLHPLVRRLKISPAIGAADGPGAQGWVNTGERSWVPPSPASLARAGSSAPRAGAGRGSREARADAVASWMLARQAERATRAAPAVVARIEGGEERGGGHPPAGFRSLPSPAPLPPQPSLCAIQWLRVAASTRNVPATLLYMQCDAERRECDASPPRNCAGESPSCGAPLSSTDHHRSPTVVESAQLR
jgi:hypothetical protein